MGCGLGRGRLRCVVFGRRLARGRAGRRRCCSLFGTRVVSGYDWGLGIGYMGGVREVYLLGGR